MKLKMIVFIPALIVVGMVMGGGKAKAHGSTFPPDPCDGARSVPCPKQPPLDPSTCTLCHQ